MRTVDESERTERITVMNMFRSTKTYGHEIGLSCAFRQWRADSHCRFLHGYAIAVRLEFEAQELDRRNWVVDFGSLKTVKTWLENTFDHKTLVAKDDPLWQDFRLLHDQGALQMIEVEHTGCEAFAKLIGECVQVWLKDNGYVPRVRLASCEVREHGANSAIWTPGV
jgi:6-pyruvoyltetrahydropterin/6-carboxytetrahydropterin synthase